MDNLSTLQHRRSGLREFEKHSKLSQDNEDNLSIYSQ